MKSKLKFILSFLSVFSFAFSAFAQDATLSGRITEEGYPDDGLIGATIKVGETGVITDFDGNYSIQLAPGSYDVEFSYVGLETLTQTIDLGLGENKVMNLVMSESVNLMDAVTVTAGKHEQKQSEVVVSLAIIQPELLESNNNTAVDQVIQKVPGVEIVDGQASIRGGAGYSFGAGTRVLLLLDDIPILQADAGFPLWNDIPIENISQIEVVKGAASALYGSSAMNGIINIRTAYAKSEPETSISTFAQVFESFNDEDGIDRSWWNSAQTITDEDGTTREHTPSLFGDEDGFNVPSRVGLSVAHRRKIGKRFDLVLGGFAVRSDGFNRETFNRYGRFNIGTKYRISDRLTAGFNSNFNRTNSGSFFFWNNNEDGSTIASPGVTSQTSAVRYTIDPFLTYYDKAGNRHKLLTRFYSVVNENSGNRSNFSNLSYGEYQFQKDFSEHQLIATAGVVGIKTNVEAQLYSDTTFTSDNLAGYLQLDKKVGEKLNLSVGGRYEWNRLISPTSVTVDAVNATFPIKDGIDIDAKAVFRAGFNYAFADYTHLRGSWGQGYRYPTIAEKFINTQLGEGDGPFVPKIIPNPELQSETGWTAELAIQQGWQIPNTELKGFVDLSFFYQEYQNMMEFGINPNFNGVIFNSQNVGDTRVYGTELNLAGTGQISENLGVTFLMGYTYIVPKFKDWDITGKDLTSADFAADDIPNRVGKLNAFLSSSDENVLKYRFDHTFKADIEFNLGKFKLGGSILANSEMRAIDNIFLGIINGVEEFRAENKGFQVIDARTSYQISDVFKVSIVGKNLLGLTYSVRPGILEAPRNWALRVDASF